MLFSPPYVILIPFVQILFEFLSDLCRERELPLGPWKELSCHVVGEERFDAVKQVICL